MQKLYCLNSILDHEEKIHGHLKQTCERCNEVCLSLKHLASHIAYKHCTKNEKGQYICVYCGTIKKSRQQILGYHILNKHFNQPPYPCDKCDKGFDTKGYYDVHVKSVHSEERSFQCDKCAKSFKTLLSLNIHVGNVHEVQIEQKCEDCDKIFKNLRYLKTHQKLMHSGIERTRIMCDDCGKSFACKQKFKIHCLNVHSNAEEKAKHTLTCEYPGCTYSGLSKTHLKRHYDRVHLQKRNYKCSLCPKGFFDRKILEEHTNGVHLNVKPFQCDMCEFASAYSTKLAEHKKVAHGNQRFDCPHCNHSARYKGNLDKHINNVHKNLSCLLTDRQIL